MCAAVEETNTEGIFAVMNTTELVVELRSEKNSGPHGIWTHDLCDTGEALHQQLELTSQLALGTDRKARSPSNFNLDLIVTNKFMVDYCKFLDGL